MRNKKDQKNAPEEPNMYKKGVSKSKYSRGILSSNWNNIFLYPYLFTLNFTKIKNPPLKEAGYN